MAVFKCKMCGGTIEFEQGATVGVCDSCGTKQTLPRLDDDNIEANEGVARLGAKNKWSDYYVIKPEISTQENVNRFLNGLSEAENIACDIYANIKIKSIKEKYFDFSFLKASGNVSWTAIRCDEHIENETVYKTKYENGKQVQVPETNKVTRVDRTPISGSQKWNCEELFFASNAIVKSLNSEKSSSAQKLNDKFVKLQVELYGKYKPVKLNPKKISEKDGISKYDGIQIEVTTDLSRQGKISDDLIDSATSACLYGALNRTKATYYENIDAKGSISSKTIAKILFPVQIIVYEYKEKEYTAISSLSDKSQFIQTIPTDIELCNSQSEISLARHKLTKMGHDVPLEILIPGAIGSIIAIMVILGDHYPKTNIPYMFMVIIIVLALIFLFVYLSKEKAIKEEIAAKSVEHKMLLKPKTSLLQSTKSKFFENYSDISSVESASKCAKINDSMISNIKVLRTIVAVNKECYEETEERWKKAEADEAEEYAKVLKKEAEEKVYRKNVRVVAICAVIVVIVIVALGVLSAHRGSTGYDGDRLGSGEEVESITFGDYEQDGNSSNGKEEIEWLVLEIEDDKALVISKYALDSQPYNGLTWETCTLRTWLNGTFLNSAFSETEQAAIAQTTVSADKNSKFDTDPGNATTDKVFLLSIDEAEKYFLSDNARQCEPTATCAVDQGYYEGDRGNCWWWLRTPGSNQANAARVTGVGSVGYVGTNVSNDCGAVRPAMWINLDA